MQAINLLELLAKVRAIITDSHIVYTSGRHGSAYVNKDALYPYPNLLSGVCTSFARYFDSFNIDVVAAPAIGGVALSQWTAYHLSSPGTQVLSVYAEKQADSSFIFRRGYDRLLNGKRILVLEDIVTTGRSLKAVIDAVAAAGGTVAGAGAICNRGGITADVLGTPILHALADLPLDSWSAEECPLCLANVPINVNVGKGREFLQGIETTSRK